MILDTLAVVLLAAILISVWTATFRSNKPKRTPKPRDVPPPKKPFK